MNHYRRRINTRSRALLSEINITPFVDVMLVLLIVFMVTSPLMIAGVNVDLPENESTPITSSVEPLSITIDSRGNIYIQDTKIDNDNIVDKLKAITNEKYDSRIFVRGDRNVDYGVIMNVVGSISQAGFSKVTLITQMKFN